MSGHRRQSLCKIHLDDHIFLDWLFKSLLPIIAKDVASEHLQTKEEAIMRDQQYYLIYAQSGYLYTIIPGGTNSSSRDQPEASHSSDGVIGMINSTPIPYGQVATSNGTNGLCI